MNSSHYLDPFLFAICPYIALFLLFFVSIQRYRSRAFTYSALSSQFLENRVHFWALVPFHYAILAVLAGHLIAFLIPGQLLLWNSRPVRLYALEVTGLIFSVLALLGLLTAITRRLRARRLRVVTTASDWVLLLLLLVQISTGIYIAWSYAWGSSWFATLVTPYLWSILKLKPEINTITALPFWVKVHILNAFVLVGFLPFTRLVHVLVVPNPYLWRRPQVVRWYRRPEGA